MWITSVWKILENLILIHRIPGCNILFQTLNVKSAPSSSNIPPSNTCSRQTRFSSFLLFPLSISKRFSKHYWILLLVQLPLNKLGVLWTWLPWNQFMSANGAVAHFLFVNTIGNHRVLVLWLRQFFYDLREST